jgi:hypothetical protein
VDQIPQVTKHRHESLGFEREAVWVKLGGRRGGVEDVFVGDLVSEEGVEDREEAGYKFVVFDKMCGDGGDGEELEGKVFDGGFRIPVHEEVGV